MLKLSGGANYEGFLHGIRLYPDNCPVGACNDVCTALLMKSKVALIRANRKRISTRIERLEEKRKTVFSDVMNKYPYEVYGIRGEMKAEKAVKKIDEELKLLHQYRFCLDRSVYNLEEPERTAEQELQDAEYEYTRIKQREQEELQHEKEMHERLLKDGYINTRR